MVGFGGYGGDQEKLLSVEQWGTQVWTYLAGAFALCSNMDMNATDAPDLSSVTSLAGTFRGIANINGDLSSWNTANVTIMQGMFEGLTSFNSDISNWNTSNVTDMGYMFRNNSLFNQPLNSWNVSSVTNMQGMFEGASSFNQPLNSWNVSSVTNMGVLFHGATSFNQDIGDWDVTSVASMSSMFSVATSFNQPQINNWDMSNVTNIRNMFSNSNFNQPLNSWDVSNVTNMGSTFFYSNFNQDISSWDVSSVTTMEDMFISSWLSRQNYDALLEAWSTLPLQNNVQLDMGATQAQSVGYCTAEAARADIITNFNWVINDGGSVCPDLLINSSGIFSESSANDGSMGGDEQILFNPGGNATFADVTFTEGTHYTVANVPTGLTSNILRENGGLLSLSLSGNATSHTPADDISNIEITFLDPAFEDVPSDLIGNNPLTGFSIEFTDIDPPPDTSAPTNISLSNSSIDENITPPGDVGTLTTEDPDSGDTFSYTLDCDSSAPDDSSFFIDTDQLKLNLSADYETKNSYDICIRSTDQTGKSYQKNFTIDINDLDESQPTPQTDFSLSISLLQTGEIKAGDTVTYKYTVKNEGPNDAELIGGLYIITPPEFTVGTIDKPVQSPDPIGPMPVSSVGLSVISSSYPGYNFVIFESESDPSHTVFTSGVSETFTITGNANTDFTNNQTTTRAIYGNADYEDTEAIALNTAIQSNQDFFLLPGNNVAHHTYTHGLSNPPTNPTNPFVNFTPKPASTGHPLASTGGIVASLSFISGTLLMIGALFIYAKRGIE